MKTALNRRQIISLATTLLLGGIAGCDTRFFNPDRLVANPDNLQAFSHLDSLRSLGRKCADLVPYDQQQLLNMAGLGSATGVQEQAARFVRKRQEDFLLGRTRIVSGWVLAEAECALCVLCAQA